MLFRRPTVNFPQVESTSQSRVGLSQVLHIPFIFTARTYTPLHLLLLIYLPTNKPLIHNTVMTSAMTHCPPMVSVPPQVKVNVRLCGSIPRQEMESLTLKQQQLQQNRPSDEVHSQYMSSATSLKASSIRDSMSLLTSALHQHQEAEEEGTRLGPLSSSSSFPPQHSVPAALNRKPPTFEAPSWAVPASGETRLEVCCFPVLTCSRGASLFCHRIFTHSVWSPLLFLPGLLRQITANW